MNVKKINQSGFTLLELLVAIMILAIGLSAAATMQGIALSSNVVANRVSAASFLAQQVAEEISSRAITDPVLKSGTGGWVTYQFASWSTGSLTQVNSLNITSAGTFTANINVLPNTFNGVPFYGMTEILVSVNNKYTYTAHKSLL